MKQKLTTEQNKKIETFAIAMLIVFALTSFFITKSLNKKNTRELSIFLSGEKITEINGIKIDLNSDGVFTIGDRNSSYNVIEIKNKKVRCIDASCSDKICVNHGFLHDNIDNDMIVCAPNKLLIIYN